jgi:PAS domain-containing protein
MSLITLTVILMGMSAGSVVNLASYLPSFAGVVGPSMGALVGLLFWYGDTASTTVAVLAAIASLAYIVGARNVHKLLKASLELGFENVALRRDAEEKTTLLEATLHNMGQGISLSDPEGRLRMWNPQFLDLLGLSKLQLAEGDRLEAVLKTARPPIDAGNASRSEYRREDGAVVEIAQNAMPDGGRVVTYADITDLKTRETALETARQEAEVDTAVEDVVLPLRMQHAIEVEEQDHPGPPNPFLSAFMRYRRTGGRRALIAPCPNRSRPRTLLASGHRATGVPPMIWRLQVLCLSSNRPLLRPLPQSTIRQPDRHPTRLSHRT